MRSQIFVGQRPQWSKFNYPKNREAFNKPLGGLWTSTFHRRYVSDWVQWCLTEDFGERPFKCWLLKPDKCKIYTINYYLDYRNLLSEFPIQYKGLESLGLFLNFEKIAKKYDGIRLTQRGQIATRFSLGDNFLNLYGWDCESTLWLRWRFFKVHKYKTFIKT